jgi:hypothetical protein
MNEGKNRVKNKEYLPSGASSSHQIFVLKILGKGGSLDAGFPQQSTWIKAYQSQTCVKIVTFIGSTAQPAPAKPLRAAVESTKCNRQGL